MKRPKGGSVAFPLTGHSLPRHGSTSSVSSTDIPSPVSLSVLKLVLALASKEPQFATRRPIQRHTSNSSASLSFKLSIPGPEAKPPARPALRQNHSIHLTQAKVGNRLTYSESDISASLEAQPLLNPPLPNCSEEPTGIADSLVDHQIPRLPSQLLTPLFQVRKTPSPSCQRHANLDSVIRE